LAQLIRPGSVKVITQDGEVQVSIALELTINLNTDGLQLSAQGRPESIEKSKELKKKDDVMMEIPDFAPSPKVDFGKKQ
jgi:uncharacterized protein YjhX (UPF0386 family)